MNSKFILAAFAVSLGIQNSYCHQKPETKKESIDIEDKKFYEAKRNLDILDLMKDIQKIFDTIVALKSDLKNLKKQYYDARLEIQKAKIAANPHFDHKKKSQILNDTKLLKKELIGKATRLVELIKKL